MNYNISFKVKVEGIDKYIEVGNCDTNIVWGVRQIITLVTGLDWKYDANNGRCINIIPCIKKGLCELQENPNRYRQYEDAECGKVEDIIKFFQRILNAWLEFRMEEDPEIVSVATFWIE